jgi:hypothetical protein
MAILRNEPVFPFKDEDYCRPRHIIVEGSYEEIGYDLATIGREEYDVKLRVYRDPVYAEAKRDYLERNWPEMLAQSKGVLRAFDLAEDDNTFDPTALTYDLYDEGDGGRVNFGACTGLVLPNEKTDTGAPFVSRNAEMVKMVLFSEMFGKKAPAGAHLCFTRDVVVEKRPTGGYRSILHGGHELLTPFCDSINEKGLFVSTFHDPSTYGVEGAPTSGYVWSGLALVQLMSQLMDQCATVEEAKRVILRSHLWQSLFVLHLLIADAEGNATVFEIDGSSGAYLFTDRVEGEPLFCTNHPLHTYPTPDTYPDVNMEAEHNTFTRQIILRNKYQDFAMPLKRDDATALTDSVHVAFQDPEKAESSATMRTLFNCNADLSKPEINIRWHLGDGGPIAGTNHIKQRVSDFHTFGF